jgi:MoaA/NifB/PqqE/SkfB family radical SAM enzyme
MSIFKTSDKSLHIQVGYACNNSCVFCMESNKRERFLTVTEFLKNRIYKELEKGKDYEKVVFTTGEPTLNPHLMEYVKYAKGAGYKKISIATNGRMLKNSNFAYSLLEGGATEFVIPLHGYSKKIHESLTMSEGSFAQTKKGIENLSKFREKMQFALVISQVVNKKNYKHLEKFLLLCKKYQVDEVVLNVVQPRGPNMKKNFKELMVRYGDLEKVIEKIYSSNKELFRSNLKKNEFYVRVIDMPLCVLKNKKMAGFEGHKHIEIDRKTSFFTTAKYKVKRKECEKCRYSKICGGIYENYIKNFGWDEFVPIEK